MSLRGLLPKRKCRIKSCFPRYENTKSMSLRPCLLRQSKCCTTLPPPKDETLSGRQQHVLTWVPFHSSLHEVCGSVVLLGDFLVQILGFTGVLLVLKAVTEERYSKRKRAHFGEQNLPFLPAIFPPLV